MFPFRINRYHGRSTFPLQAKTTTETGEVMIPLKRNETDSVTCVRCLVKTQFFMFTGFQ